MERSCRQCQAVFDITDTDRALYVRLQVPEPTICSVCSERLRFSFRNERHFYKRKSDLSGKDIVTIYAPDTPYKVYHREEWFSDAYDPLTYGRDVDFQRPFFDQLYDLSLAVPYEHMVIMNSVNCDYCNFIVNSKNCYMSMRIDAEDVSYCYLVFGKSKDCIDCHTINACELCYECIDCVNSYASCSCQRCRQCSDCAFCIDCIGCHHCFGCVGLRQKEYHFFNRPYSKEEYERAVRAEYQTQTHTGARKAWEALQALDLTLPHRPAIIDQSESVSGDYIVRSKNVQRSFDVEQCEDAIDCAGIEYSKDVARSCFLYYGELCYEQVSCIPSHSIQFSYGAYDSHDIEYCMMAHNGSHHCFGSIGLKHNAYVVLNKQYTQEEYGHVRDRLVEHMKQTGEYGHFFPPKLVHFAYNETVAQEFHPLTKEEALTLGYRWRDVLDEPQAASNTLDGSELPDNIEDVSDDILQVAIRCAKSGRFFRITKKELDFYRAHKIPLPHLHPDERHYHRMSLRNPRKLWKRTCVKCGKDIQTTYAPDRPEIVYCEECYLASVY